MYTVVVCKSVKGKKMLCQHEQ